MSQRRYRVGIDCRLSGQRHAGIGRYIENLVRELLKLPADIDWIFFFSDKEQAEQVLESTPSTHFSVVYTPFQHYSLAEQLKLPAIFSQQNLDLLHVPHFNVPFFYKGEIVVTIHDLLWHEYRGAAVTTLPSWQYWPKYMMYRKTVDYAIAKAKRIIVPAQTVADQVQQYYPNTHFKLSVIPEGVEEKFYQSEHVGPKGEKYLVYVGSLYPHKNVKVALEALLLLPNYHLKIISSRSVFQEKLRATVDEMKLNDRVTFLGHLSDEAVAELLKHAVALIQPSLSEGFGLTGLEAMAAGTPVVASDIPVFREVYQDHAEYFPPHDSAAFVSAVQKVEKYDVARYQKDSKAFAQTYTWAKMAKAILSIYTAQLSHQNG